MWTGQAFLDAALHLGGFDDGHWQLAIQRVREALDAVDADGAPDHATRLRSAELATTWLQFKRAELPSLTDATRPLTLNIAIVNTSVGNGHAGHAPEANGGSIRVVNRERDES